MSLCCGCLYRGRDGNYDAQWLHLKHGMFSPTHTASAVPEAEQWPLCVPEVDTKHKLICTSALHSRDKRTEKLSSPPHLHPQAHPFSLMAISQLIPITQQMWRSLTFFTLWQGHLASRTPLYLIRRFYWHSQWMDELLKTLMTWMCAVQG